MKSVLISIQPYYVFLIIAKAMGWNIEKEKTVEVRKSYPKANDWNKTVKMYCSKDKKSFSMIPKKYQPLMQQFLGKVIGEFMCNKIDYWQNHYKTDVMHIADMSSLSCVSIDDLLDYLGHYVDMNGVDKRLYAWHISDIVIYGKPKGLSEFQKFGALNYDDWLYGMYNGSSESSYEKYLIPFKMSRPPQSWCYVEG